MHLIRTPLNSMVLVCLIIGSFLTSQFVYSETVSNKIPAELQEVGIKEHLGDQVSIAELNFQDETGKTVRLSDYFHKGRPVILTLVYYECPNLCNFLLNGFVKTLKK